VGIYFSQNNVHCTTGIGIPVFTQLLRQLDAAVRNIERYGLSPAVISNHEVEADPDCLRDFKFIVFPFCASLSRREAKAIAAFVEAGGTALVDPLFGLYDEDGRYTPGGMCPWFVREPRDHLGAFADPGEIGGDGAVLRQDAPENRKLLYKVSVIQTVACQARRLTYTHRAAPKPNRVGRAPSPDATFYETRRYCLNRRQGLARDARGQTAPPFVKKVWVRDQETVRFPLAYNDAVGKWRARVKETITGRTLSKSVQVSD